MNETISACWFLKMEGSYMRGFTVLGSTVLVLIILNSAISACMFLNVEGSFTYMDCYCIFSVFLSSQWRSMYVTGKPMILFILLKAAFPVSSSLLSISIFMLFLILNTQGCSRLVFKQIYFCFKGWLLALNLCKLWNLSLRVRPLLLKTAGAMQARRKHFWIGGANLPKAKVKHWR